MPTTTTGLATSFINFSRPGASGGGATTTLSNGRIGWAGHNLLTNSESFDASSWLSFAATVNANVTAAPNGTTTADKICEWTGTGAQTRYQTFTVGTAGSTFTLTVYAKKDERNFITVSLSDQPATGWIAATFNLDAVTVTKSQASGVSGYALVGTPSITAIGNGWCQCVLTGTLGTAGTNYCYVGPVTTGTPTYGNSGIVNSTGTAPNGVFVWGAHLYRSDLGSMQLNPSMPAGMQSYYPTTPRNLLGYSEDFSTGWTRTNVLAFGSGSISNAAVAPNGLQTADKIVPTTAANDRHSIYQIIALGSGVNVISVYAKAGEYSLLRLADQSNGTFYASYDLAAGSVVSGSTGGTKYTSSAIASAGNGWYRCSMVVTNVAASTAIAFGGYPSGATLDNFGGTFTGDGVSGIYLWGAQLSDSASLDTYVPVYGAAVTSAAYYAPRLDFDGATLSPKGLLVEEQRVNLLTYSNEFNDTSWVGYADVTANATTSPDGTSNADMFSSISNTNSLYKAVTVTQNTAYTFSIYVKLGTLAAASFMMAFRDDTAGTFIATDVPAPIAPTSTGWTRVTYTLTTPAGCTTLRVYPVRQASGSSGTVYLYGAQLEAGSFATSYIPTGASTATRTADVASVSTQAFPYSASEGTLVVSGAFSKNGRYAGLYNAATSDQIEITQLETQVNGFVYASGAAQANLVQALSPFTAAKVGLAAKLNDFAMSTNGSAVATDTSGIMPTPASILYFNVYGASGVTSVLGSGHIRQITYLPRRISNAELISRTS